MIPAGLTIFQGVLADRNARGLAGARRLGGALADRLALPARHLGAPGAPTTGDYAQALDAATPDLRGLGRAVDELLEADGFPVLTMSRCLGALATLPVVARRRPACRVVWFDAHADSQTPQSSQTGYLGGMILTGAAGMWDTGLEAGLDLGSVVLVGARDIDAFEQDLIDQGRLALVPPGPDVAGRLREHLAGAPAYVHLDCDVLTAGIVPSDYQVPGGLTLEELGAALEAAWEGGAVGLEIAEFEDAWPDGAPGDVEPLADIVASAVRAAN